MSPPLTHDDDSHARVPLRAVAFDLDGTLYIGHQVMPGAPEIVAGVRGRGLATLFLTNTFMEDATQLRERLAGMGIAAAVADIYGSATAAARHCKERGHHTAYVVGTGAMRTELTARGIALTERGEEADALVVGHIPDFDAATMADGFRSDCEFVAANIDADYPIEGGVRLPGAGQTVARVAARLGRSYDFLAGKPGTYMLECLERDRGLSAAEIVVVGDSEASDIAMARAAGCRSVLITDRQPAARATHATLAIANLRELPAALDALCAG